MPATQIYTREAALIKATNIKAALAASKLRLFKAGLVSLSQFTTKAQLVAAEADFDNYTAGGYALAVWVGPLADTNGGAVISSPMVTPTFADPSDPPVTNSIGGWWVEDATGNVRVAGTYDVPWSMQNVGDGWSQVVQIVEARNAYYVALEA